MAVKGMLIFNHADKYFVYVSRYSGMDRHPIVPVINCHPVI